MILAAQQSVRNAKRVADILSILTKYGLADWASGIEIDWIREIATRRAGAEAVAAASTAERVRRAVAELGATFIKLAQMLSVRPELIGKDLALELSHLQSRVPPDPPEAVRATVEAELGKKLEDVYATFDLTALASASIGQVHRAALRPGGEAVVVKVQHPGIVEKLEADLEIIVWLADLLERHVDDARAYRPRETAAEFRRGLLREVDFTREARALDQFGAAFADDPTIHIPRVHPELTTPRVMTMEFLDGIRASDLAALDAAGVDRRKLAVDGGAAFLRMIFAQGHYHADPHPGNFLVLRDGRIGILDFGLTGRIDEELREDVEDLLEAIILKDAERLVATIERVGSCPPDLDRAALKHDTLDLVEAYVGLPLDKVDTGKVLGELTDLLRRHRIVLPAGLSVLLKTLITLEGTGRHLDPQFQLTSLIGPFRQQMIARRLSPERYVRRLRAFTSDLESAARRVPAAAARVVERLERGDLEVKVANPGLERAAARVATAIVAAAFILGGVGLKAAALLRGDLFTGVLAGLAGFAGLLLAVKAARG